MFSSQRRRWATIATPTNKGLSYAKQWSNRNLGDPGLPGHQPAHRQPVAGRWRTGRRRRTEAVRPGAGVRHRTGPQDRRHRRSLGGFGRRPDGGAAPGGQRRTARLTAGFADRSRSMGADHTRMISQPDQLLLDLIPGSAKRMPATTPSVISVGFGSTSSVVAGGSPRTVVRRLRRSSRQVLAGGR